ncbi:MAG: white collar [Lasallia pustulata]|uniref:White collar n=1 Tax=Lasallia pustulata TaxID=136370 RepID=A0A5M8PQZ4_9LECA|nr:MAG: white collar [Lasallia pustulata]
MKPLVIPYNINGRQRSPPIAPGLYEPVAETSSTEVHAIPHIAEEIPGLLPQIPDRATQSAYPFAHISDEAGSPDSAVSDRGSGHTGSMDGYGSSDNDTYVTRPTTASSLAEAPIQGREPDDDMALKMHLEDYDLETTVEDVDETNSLEAFSDLLFSGEHLRSIFADTSSLLDFTAFLSEYRPHSVPILVYYLDATKALRAFRYANAIAEGLGPIPGLDFTSTPAKSTVNPLLEAKAQQAFSLLLQDDLPGYVTHVYVQVAKSSMNKRITTATVPSSHCEPDGLAEVFCLTEPTRPDNPIVFVSEAFHQLTQYGVSNTIGRNCRFLQGPKTNPASVRRLRNSIEAGQEHCEIILNYRRDGSPFMNLLMHAPLCDNSGNVRYYLGAQVDVSGVFKDGVGLDSVQRVIEQHNRQKGGKNGERLSTGEKKTNFQQLSEMFDLEELRTVQDWGDRTLQPPNSNKPEPDTVKLRRQGMVLREPSLEHLSIHPDVDPKPKPSGFYAHYMLVRPHPSLRILFAAPSLRVPGLVQSPIMDKIGGSPRVRDELAQALAAGRGVTARIRWISRAGEEGRQRWIHFTPLLRKDGHIGVWVVILIDDDDDANPADDPSSHGCDSEPDPSFPSSLATPAAPLRRPPATAPRPSPRAHPPRQDLLVRPGSRAGAAPRVAALGGGEAVVFAVAPGAGRRGVGADGRFGRHGRDGG